MDDTINMQSALRLFHQIEERNFKLGRIYIIRDNTRQN